MSRGHRENIFNESFKFCGVGAFTHTVYKTAIVFDFAGGLKGKSTEKPESLSSEFKNLSLEKNEEKKKEIKNPTVKPKIQPVPKNQPAPKTQSKISTKPEEKKIATIDKKKPAPTTGKTKLTSAPKDEDTKWMDGAVSTKTSTKTSTVGKTKTTVTTITCTFKDGSTKKVTKQVTETLP